MKDSWKEIPNHQAEAAWKLIAANSGFTVAKHL